MNKRDQAIIDWCKARRPDCLGYFLRIIDDGSTMPHNDHAQALYLLLCISFESGRMFQADTNAELNNPNIYI